MTLLEHISNAFRTFTSNKLRAGLSSLGIIIGVYSVVVLLAIGQGAQNSILSNVQSLGSNLLTLTPGGSRQSDVRSKTAGKSRTDILTASVVERIRQVPGVVDVSPEMSTRKQIINADKNLSVTIYGVEPIYAKVRNTELASGVFFTDDQVKNNEAVTILGSTTATTLFGSGADPLGSTVRIGGSLFRVIGVTKSKWQQSFGNADETAYIPVSTAQDQLLGTNYYSTVAITTATTEDLTPTKERLQRMLDGYFSITNENERSYTVNNQADLISTVSQITGALTLFLGAIAVISLVVGGIGVMNIMLVSITERTREIGIRKAIGAQKSDIVLQFLTESLLLCIIGWLIAIGLSYLTIFAISSLIQWVITLSTLTLAFGFSCFVGIGFGIYPAYKAASLKPIDALRFE